MQKATDLHLDRLSDCPIGYQLEWFIQSDSKIYGSEVRVLVLKFFSVSVPQIPKLS